MTNILRAYRTSSADGATHIGLLLSVYDSLVEDISLAGEAAQRADLGSRCRHSQHALLLLGHLEDWISLLDDVGLQQSLRTFYAYVRTEVLRLQATDCKGGFPELAMRVSETRAAWQKKESHAASILEYSPPALAANSEEPAVSGICWFG